MRLLATSVLTAVVAVHVAAEQQPPSGRLYRGPLIAERPATFVMPQRPLPIEFEAARLDMSGAAPWAALANARLYTRVRSNTVWPVSVRGITLRVAVGPAEHGIVTFRMRGMTSTYAPEESDRIAQDGLFRPAMFTTIDDSFPRFLLYDRSTKVVFTLERLESDDNRVVFENPDAIELLWQALGRPSLTSQ